MESSIHNLTDFQPDKIDERFLTDSPEQKAWLRDYIIKATKEFLDRGNKIKLLVLNGHAPPSNLSKDYEVLEINDIGTDLKKTNRLHQSAKAILKLMKPDKYYSTVDLIYVSKMSENKINEVLDFLLKEQYIEGRGGNNKSFIKIGDLLNGY